ncbi:cellulose biosynthesis protein CelD [Hyphomicrobium methylovorum]|uniref:GNAT family N-acetyltransferase n=1 Tax=Hyphomicrobium methylovorum TaxID=84 RepID=UPI0015E79E72|nr:GNAT family N-acetyltransferase [Hyphomicrobium methylovorum]MBA2124617.1 cellulose biosynthesis protein CelD [Hyphomicrobium methylovorum]
MDAAARLLPSHSVAPPAPMPKQARLTANDFPDVTFRIVTERADFDALESEWNALFDRAARSIHVFQTFNFCWHWANHYLKPRPDGPSSRLSIVTAHRAGRLILVWPLVSERVRGVTQTYWMGEPLAQYGDALVDNEGDADALLQASYDFLKAQLASDLLRLRRVRADANVAGILADSGAHAADHQIAPYMDLSSAPNFAAFEERFSSKARRNRKRLARRLEDKGQVAFLRLRGGEAAGDLAQRAIALKSAWLKDRGLVSNAFSDARASSVFADLAKGFAKPAGCIVSALTVDGECAALDIAFACKGRLAVHVMAFNLEFEKSGVGVLLLEHGLKDAYTEQIASYDLMAPGDAYKLDWCDRSEDVIDWVQPLNAKGYAYSRVYLGFLRTRLKAWLKALPQPMRRFMRKDMQTGANNSAS